MRPSSATKQKEIPTKTVPKSQPSSITKAQPSTLTKTQTSSISKAQPSTLPKKPTTTSSTSSIPKEPRALPMTEEEKRIKREIIDPLNQFECLRNTLLQWIYLNNSFKEQKTALKERMEVEFYDRTQQVLEAQDKAMEMKINISREEAIKELEEILSFEHGQCQQISQGIVDFEENLEILKDYMENGLKKIEVGENIVIYPEEFNEELVNIKNKLGELETKYKEEWETSDSIEEKMKEFIELSLEEHQELMALIELMASKQSAIEKRNFEDYTDFQESRVKDLEALIFGEL